MPIKNRFYGGADTEYVAGHLFPRGVVDAPEKYGAVGNGVELFDAAVQSGNVTISSSGFAGVGAGRTICIMGIGASTSYGTTSAGITNGTAISSLPVNSLAGAVPAGPVVVTSGGSAWVFWTNGAGAGATSLSSAVGTQTPNVTIGSGAAVRSFGAAFTTTLNSVASGTAVLAVAATSTMQNAYGYFGTDDTAAFQQALDNINGNGTLLLDGKNYLTTATPRTDRKGNCQIALNTLAQVGSGNAINNYLLRIEGVRSQTKILSTATGLSYSALNGPPSVLGGPTQEQYGTGFPAVGSIHMDGVQVVVPANATLGAIYLRTHASAFTRRVVTQDAGSSVGGPYGAIGTIVTSHGSFGLIYPRMQGNGHNRLESFSSRGHYCGLQISEHCVVHADIFNCVVGLALDDGNGGGHRNILEYADIEGCIHCVSGYDPNNGQRALTGGPYYLQGHLDFEDHVAQWNPQYHINDPNNTIVGQRSDGIRETFLGNAPGFLLNGGAYFDMRSTVRDTLSGYDDIVLADSPLAYIPLQEASGTTAVDATGNGHSGTHTGNPILGLSGPMRLDHSTRYISAATQYTLLDTLGSFGSSMATATLEFWILSTSTAAQIIMGFANTTAGVAGLSVSSNVDANTGGLQGSTQIQVYSGSNSRGVSFSGINLYDGNWHHVVIQPSVTGTTQAWVDGIIQSMTLQTSPPTLGTMGNFTGGGFALNGRNYIGLGGVGNLFDQRLARVAFYTTQLSLARIQAHFGAGIRRG